MTKKILNLSDISGNEFMLDNDVPATILVLPHNAEYVVDPGWTIMVPDKLKVRISVKEDDAHAAATWVREIRETVAPGDFVPYRLIVDFSAQIEAERNKHLAAIDEAAEKIRGIFITLGAGQAIVYQRKREEALAYMANPQIAPAAIPHVSFEAQDEGVSLEAKVNEIMDVSNAWIMISAEIERRRTAAKRAIRDAADLESMDAAFAAVSWADIVPS